MNTNYLWDYPKPLVIWTTPTECTKIAKRIGCCEKSATGCGQTTSIICVQYSSTQCSAQHRKIVI